MRIIEIEKRSNGSHRNQSGNITIIPDGWAVVPDDLETVNFPFGEIEVAEIDGIMVVTSWTPNEMPKIEEEEKSEEFKPTAQDDIDTMLIDHELRLTMLELGV
jgi:hypothetical protein